MSRIVLTTSSSGLDDMDIQHNVELIRLRIHVNDVEFIDGKNINSERLQYLMNEVSHSPVHTSPAPAHEVAMILSNLQSRGIKEVFITTLSSKVSESYQIISEVAKSFADNMDIYVYDTKDLNACEALLALEADYFMQQGYAMSDIASRLDALRRSHHMLFAADDLSYLIKNKKISGAAGFFANLFSIKPVLQVSKEGEVVPISKIRKIDKAFEYMVNQFAEVLPRKDSFAYILSAGRPDLDSRFIEMLKQRTGVDNIAVLPVSAISLANHGPSGLGLCVFEGDVPQAASMFAKF
ncbi:DegV domain-containing protein [Psychrobacter pasteurii]|uniref:DegV domain-containing protein n=1 Tax=Psychrobacter pasteurii TaxID=1945520 RepID=A0A1R4ECV9_9GAMM|nr:DegV family protein [Psychrobacter pasteurii]SJM36278.1 DegV domain-containing protein [Psychrobacter pasteurii]